MPVRIASLAWSLAPVVALCAGGATAQPGDDAAVLLAPGPFAPGLPGWVQRGNAQFSADDTRTREGATSARITIPPGTKLEYQQLRRDFPAREGDQLRASVWVRTVDLSGDSGAYMALEFVGPGDQRVGIAHSAIGLGNGREEWTQLSAEGQAPLGTETARVSLVLHATGSAWFSAPELARTGRLEDWPDLGDATREVTVDTAKVVQPHYLGVGFHTFHHIFDWTRDELDQDIVKRWRELDPAFVRMNDNHGWDKAMLDKVAAHMRTIQGDTNTTIYVTTWDPPEVTGEAALKQYARETVDRLEYWVRDCGITNIRYYCMTNELSLGKWGSLAQDLPRFRAYHQALYDELKARNLDIGLLATDASPVEWWWTVEWATRNMDDITAVYGGHHYINDRPLSDERFYPWWLEKTRAGASLARGVGKDFILGEFGAKQDGSQVRGKLNDACIYWDTPQEKYVAIQLAEAIIGATNAGIAAMGYWTFMDFPEDWNPTYRNKWGTFKCDGGDFSTRDIYYGLGLLTRFFRGPGEIFRVDCSDPRLRVAALRSAAGAWSIAVVSRNRQAAPMQVTIQGVANNALLRRYVYDPEHVPQNPFGDMQAPTGTVALQAGRLTDTVAPGTLTVYTSACDDQAPAAVTGLTATPGAEGTALAWDASPEADLCYYRVYRLPDAAASPALRYQIGSTVATHFLDRTPGPPGVRYAVLAVDHSGNTSPALD
jgi:hypothetical protein